MTKNYTTYDLGLSAALITIGCKLVGIEKTNPKRVLFIFQGEEEIEKKVESFWNNEMIVSPRHYFDNIKMLKNRIYA